MYVHVYVYVHPPVNRGGGDAGLGMGEGGGDGCGKESTTFQVGRNENPGSQWSIPRTMLQELRRRISAAFCGWESPSLTSIYPAFDCGSGWTRLISGVISEGASRP